MSVNNYRDLKSHVGHTFECVVYFARVEHPEQVDNISLECLTCNEVMMAFDGPTSEEEARAEDFKELRAKLNELLVAEPPLSPEKVLLEAKKIMARASALGLHKNVALTPEWAAFAKKFGSDILNRGSAK